MLLVFANEPYMSDAELSEQELSGPELSCRVEFDKSASVKSSCESAKSSEVAKSSYHNGLRDSKQ
jgi:hypothetical protein